MNVKICDVYFFMPLFENTPYLLMISKVKGPKARAQT